MKSSRKLSAELTFNFQIESTGKEKKKEKGKPHLYILNHKTVTHDINMETSYSGPQNE